MVPDSLVVAADSLSLVIARQLLLMQFAADAAHAGTGIEIEWSRLALLMTSIGGFLFLTHNVKSKRTAFFLTMTTLMFILLLYMIEWHQRSLMLRKEVRIVSIQNPLIAVPPVGLDSLKKTLFGQIPPASLEWWCASWDPGWPRKIIYLSSAILVWWFYRREWKIIHVTRNSRHPFF